MLRHQARDSTGQGLTDCPSSGEFHGEPRNLEFVDETGMRLGLSRLYGRTPKGTRLDDTQSRGQGGQNISLFGGMSMDGFIATLNRVGSVNSAIALCCYSVYRRV